MKLPCFYLIPDPDISGLIKTSGSPVPHCYMSARQMIVHQKIKFFVIVQLFKTGYPKTLYHRCLQEVKPLALKKSIRQGWLQT